MLVSDIKETSALKNVFEAGNAFNTFVRPQAFTQWVLVSNSECKQKRCLQENSTERL